MLRLNTVLCASRCAIVLGASGIFEVDHSSPAKSLLNLASRLLRKEVSMTDNADAAGPLGGAG